MTTNNEVYAMLKVIFISVVFTVLTACATTKTSFPAKSSDGMDLMPNSKMAAWYMKPGADLSEYDKIALLDTYVSFAKRWQQNYNETASFQDQVSDKDMQKIRDKDGRPMVSAGGTGVLILRPAIINLEISAPDLMTPGMSETYVASAGSMTLYMELFDGKTGDIIGRIIDPEAEDDAGMMQISSSVTNTADFDRIVKRWAQILNGHLADVSKN
jgi:hypothetical protein